MQRRTVCLLSLVLAILVIALVVGCGGQSEVVETQRAISHALTGGTPGFYFLPPLAPKYSYQGVFDPSLSLRVPINLLDAAGDPLQPPLVTFEMAVGPKGEGIRVNTKEESYSVAWDTSRYQLQNRGIYRIYVRRASNNAEYGFADVQIFANKQEAKSLAVENIFPLIYGQTLKIKFRIEVGATPQLPPQIVFASGYPAWRTLPNPDPNAHVEVFVINADGTNLTQVTNLGQGFVACGAKWSPDGTKIAFHMCNRGVSGFRTDIWTINADGSNLTNLTNNPAWDSNACWSPDGSKIAFNSDRDGDTEIYVMNADGTNQTRLTYTPMHDVDPAWSPDGTKFAFHTGYAGWAQELFIMNADGSDPHPVPGTFNNRTVCTPDWSPDGTRLVYNACNTLATGGLESGIYTISETGADLQRLTYVPGAIDANAAWSPGGDKIAFSSTRAGGDQEIFVMDTDGSNVVQVTNNDQQDLWCDWRPAAPAGRAASPLQDDLSSVWIGPPPQRRATTRAPQESCGKGPCSMMGKMAMMQGPG